MNSNTRNCVTRILKESREVFDFKTDITLHVHFMDAVIQFCFVFIFLLILDIG